MGQDIVVTDDMNVEQVYEIFRAIPSDMQKHMPVLRELASEVKHVTEFGTRGGMSTIALLAGAPKTLVTWDIDPKATSFAHVLGKLQPVPGKEKTLLQPRTGNTLEIFIEETDLLFIDTLHTFEQLRAELKRHGNRARKYIAFHDTAKDGFGYKGEDGSTPGLRNAIKWFQEQDNPRWTVVHDDQECNGFSVIQRHAGFSFFSAGW